MAMWCTNPSPFRTAAYDGLYNGVMLTKGTTKRSLHSLRGECWGGDASAGRAISPLLGTVLVCF